MVIEPEHDAAHKDRHCPATSSLNRRYQYTPYPFPTILFFRAKAET